MLKYFVKSSSEVIWTWKFTWGEYLNYEFNFLNCYMLFQWSILYWLRFGNLCFCKEFVHLISVVTFMCIQLYVIFSCYLFNQFAYIEPSLHPKNTFHFIMVSASSNVLLNCLPIFYRGFLYLCLLWILVFSVLFLWYLCLALVWVMLAS